MSFILDALKKSESERLKKDTPGIASIPESGRQKSPHKWIWLVLALVTLNLVVLAGLMIRVDQSSSSTEVPAATADSEVNAVTPPVAATVDVIPVSEQDVPPVTVIEPDPLAGESVETPVVIQSTPADVAATPLPTATANNIQTFNDLRAKGTFVLPDMHLDIHVYSSNTADRFVFVNMSKYKENATLSEGPVVSQITPDGVILTYQGASFLLPRE